MILNATDTDLANVVQETVDLPEQDEITCTFYIIIALTM